MVSSEFFELELCGEHVIYKVVKVVSINQALSLVARIHGCPAQCVVTCHLSFHEGPQRLALNWYGLLSREEKNLAHTIQNHTLAEELAYKDGDGKV